METIICPGRDRTHIIQRPIHPNRASHVQVTHLGHDRRNAAQAQHRHAAPHQLGECAEEPAFGERRLERKEVREDADDHQQLLCRFTLYEREERSVQHIRIFDLVHVLAQEEHTCIDQLADNKTQDLAQIATGDQFISWHLRLEGHDMTGNVTWAYPKGLLARLV